MTGYVTSSADARQVLTASPQIRTHVQQMLNRRNRSLKDIVSTLQIYHDNVEEDDANAQSDGSPSRREILRNLIAFLEAC